MEPFFFNYIQTFPVANQSGQYTGVINGGFITNVEWLGVPPWLEVINSVFNSGNNTYTFTLRVKTNFAFTLAEGTYQSQIRLRYRSFVLGDFNTYTLDPIDVTLSVQHYSILGATPSLLSFSYIVGDSNPQNQTIQVQSDTNWSVVASQSWVTLSSTNGVNNGSVFVGVNPSGLSVGNYSAILEITDGNTTRQVSISLSVNSQDTESTFLYVTPQNLQFISEVGEANATQQQITLDASHSWSASIQGAWLNVSSTSGSSGVQNLNISVDSAALTDTTVSYLGIITFTSQNIIKTVFVELILVEFLTQGMSSGTLYYADDRNKFLTTNIFNTDFLLLQGVASNGSVNLPFEYKAPYQNGVAKALFGLEANSLLRSVVPTNLFTTRIQNNIQPLLVDYFAYNKNKTNGATTLIAQYSNLRFLRGKTPVVSNKLCYIPESVVVPKTAKLSLSILSETPPSQIVVTGDYENTFNTSIGSNLYVYNAIIDLAPMSLSPGNEIAITFGSLTINVIIDDETPNHTLVAFENEWQEYEFVNCKGFLTKAKESTQEISETQVEDQVYSKITSIDINQSYVLNTGWIHSQEEIDWITKILDSKRVFIYLDDQPIEVVLDTKKMETFKTRQYNRSYQLKFKKAFV